MNEETMKIVMKFEKMPATPEKAKICLAYNNDEIGTFDMVQKAKAYMKEMECDHCDQCAFNDGDGCKLGKESEYAAGLCEKFEMAEASCFEET
jgi:hypothetical protein